MLTTTDAPSGDVAERAAPQRRRAAARECLARWIAGMHPAYFAMPMATGIVSIASHLLGLREVSTILFALNVPLYCGLWAATLARAIVFPERFRLDWSSHQRAPGFFTTVAATCVVGTQFDLLRGAREVALALFCLGLILWIACTYTIFVLLSTREEKPTLAEGINGGWLLAVVATQAVAILGCRVLPGRVADRDAALFFVASFWLCGGMLYIWMISLIFYRYTFFKFMPSDLMPPYWINMGAVAISTLAGTTLIDVAGDSSLVRSILPFVKGFTMLYWATATWWIPMLLGLGIWRYVVRRFRLEYDPLYWGLVFPLGMYSVCTFRLAQVMEVPSLLWVARAFVTAAIAAWVLTFLGFAARVVLVVLLALRSIARGRASGAPFRPTFGEST